MSETHLRGYKIELDLNKITQCNMNAGVARWAYNYALAIKKDAFDQKIKIPSSIDIGNQINSLKKLPEFQWLYTASSYSITCAIRSCDVAFNNFFRRCKDSKVKNKGFPKFKSKKGSKKSFTIFGTIKSLENGRIQVPHLRKICPKSKILNLSISKNNTFSKISEVHLRKIARV